MKYNNQITNWYAALRARRPSNGNSIWLNSICCALFQKTKEPHWVHDHTVHTHTHDDDDDIITCLVTEGGKIIESHLNSVELCAVCVERNRTKITGFRLAKAEAASVHTTFYCPNFFWQNISTATTNTVSIVSFIRGRCCCDPKLAFMSRIKRNFAIAKKC